MCLAPLLSNNTMKWSLRKCVSAIKEAKQPASTTWQMCRHCLEMLSTLVMKITPSCKWQHSVCHFSSAASADQARAAGNAAFTRRRYWEAEVAYSRAVGKPVAKVLRNRLPSGTSYLRLNNGTLMPCSPCCCVQTVLGVITWNRLVRYLKECMTFEDGDYLVEVQHAWGGNRLHGRCSASHANLDTGGKGNEKTGNTMWGPWPYMPCVSFLLVQDLRLE